MKYCERNIFTWQSVGSQHGRSGFLGCDTIRQYLTPTANPYFNTWNDQNRFQHILSITDFSSNIFKIYF